jgi:uncharacterized protein
MSEIETRRTSRRTRETIVDCDIHNAPVSDEALHAYLPALWRRRRQTVEYLPAYWRRFRESLGHRSYIGSEYPRPTPRAARTDAWPSSGHPPASDLAFMREQLLDRWNVEYGVLTPLLGAGEQLNLEFGAALAQAINDWQAAEWLEPEPRLRASIVVPYEDGDLSAQEIHRVASDARYVQVLLLIRTREPLGRRKYWKLYEAAEAHDLPVGIHFGGWGGWPITPSGFASYYIEDTVGMATAFQEQVASLVFEGVFERFPRLKIVLIEGGFAWLLPLMWRLDRAWQLLRDEVPHVRRLPSEYVREHFWATTQPMEEPPRKQDLHELLEQLDMSDRLMFATDYPHWDFDAPDRALPRIDPELRRKIMVQNAHALYRFEPGAKLEERQQ